MSDQRLSIQWPDVLEAMFGTSLSERQIEVWEHYLLEAKATAKELKECIKLAAREGSTVKYRATVQDLRLWLKNYRTIEAANRNAAEAESRKASFVAEWKEKLKRGADRNDFMTVVDKLPFKITDRNDICREVLYSVK